MINVDFENYFFRKAALEICAGLEVEKILHRSLREIAKTIPADSVFLQIYESKIGAMRTIAKADKHKGEKVNSLTPLPETARRRLDDISDLFRPGIVKITSPENNPVAKEMLRSHSMADKSTMHMFLHTENGNIGSVVLTSREEGAFSENHARLLSLLCRPFSIALSNVIKHREVVELRDRLSDDNRFLNKELQKQSGQEMIGAKFGLKHVALLIRQGAPTESPVLITGETGTGKDVIATRIHSESRRSGKPFIAVNCGAIPESLVDSELFGHEKGAYTGALSMKRGRFERAHEGTVFLDEIGEMPLSAQIRLLRVLQNQEIERVGGTERIPLNVRVIAATNRDLKILIAEGRFREDLWYRLNVFPIDVPPLRDRASDIPALVDHFIRLKANELKLPFQPELEKGTIEKLLSYQWPGNVRELANLVERAMIVSGDGILRIPIDAAPESKAASPAPRDSPENFPTLDQQMENHIRDALILTKGKIHGPEGAGELLGINPNTLRHRMRKLRIPFGLDYSGDPGP